MSNLLTDDETIEALGAEQHSYMASYYRQEMRKFEQVKKAQRDLSDRENSEVFREWLYRWKGRINSTVGTITFVIPMPELNIIERGEMPGGTFPSAACGD